MSTPEIGIRVIVGGVAEAHRQIGAFRNDMTRLASDMNTTKNSVTSFGRDLVRIGDGLVSFGRTLTFSVTAPILGMGTAFLKSGIDFEQAFAGVSKTVDGVSDDFGNLTDLGQQLRQSFIDMSREIPVTASELARVGQIAGQLGIGADQIGEFVDVVTKMGTATDLSSEEAAFAIARMANIMGVSADEMADFANRAANAIVELGNKVAATEPEITNLALRIAGAGRAVGLTTPEILGISAALASAGVKAEMGGSAISRILLEMKSAADNYVSSGITLTRSQGDVNAELDKLRGLLEGGEVDFSNIQDAMGDTVLDLGDVQDALRNVNTEFMSISEVVDHIESRSMARLNERLAENKDEQADLQKRQEAVGTDMQRFISLVSSGITDIDELNYAFAGTDLVLSGLSSEFKDLQDGLTTVGEIAHKVELRSLTNLKESMVDNQKEGEKLQSKISNLSDDLARLQTELQNGNTDIDKLNEMFAGTDLVLSGLEPDLRKTEQSFVDINTILNKVRTDSLSKVNDEITETTKQLNEFARVSGVSADQMVNMIKNNPAKALEVFLAGTARLNAEGGLTNETLQDLNLNTIRLQDVINRLGPNVNLLSGDIALANDQWEKQTALQVEFQKQAKTIANRLKLLKNAFIELGISIFDLVRDDLIKLIDSATKIIDSFINMDDATKKLIIRVAGMAALIGPSLLALGTFAQIAGNATIGLGSLLGIVKSFVGIPLSPLTGIMSLLFGGKAITSTKKAVIPKTKGLLGNLFGFIGNPKNTINSLFSNLFSGFTFGTSAVKSVAGALTGLLSDAFLSIKFVGHFFTSGILGIFNTIASTAANIFGVPFIGFIDDILLTPIKLLGSALGVLPNLFGKIGSAAFGALGKVGGFLGSVAGKIPVFGSTIVKWILGPFEALPKILLIAGGALLAFFAPKVITQFVKNWKDVLGQIQLSFSQFTSDLKSFGLEKAILLFFGGGSTGSGREGGLLGIAKALGASEENAKKFSYAMGTAAYWVEQIVKATYNMVRYILAGDDAMKGINKETQSTSDRLIALAAGIAKFFEGFFVGWVSSFEGIIDAAKDFGKAIRASLDAFGNLFDTIFGAAEKTTSDFYQSLNVGADSAAMKTGITVGEIIGSITEIVIRGLTFITEVTTAVVNAFTQLVQAYKTGGLKGVFDELKPTLATLFEGFIEAAKTLWGVVKPYIEAFATSTYNWLKDNGIPLIGSAFKALADIVDLTLFGAEDKVIETGKQLTLLYQNGAIIDTTSQDLTLAERAKLYSQGIQTIETTQKVSQPGFKGVVDVFKDVIKDIVDFLKKDSTQSDIWDAITTIVNGIVDIFDKLWNGTEDFKGIKTILNNFVTKDLWPWIKNTGAPAIYDAGYTLLKAFFTGMKQLIIDETGGALGKILLKGLDAAGLINEDDIEQAKTDVNTYAQEIGTSWGSGIDTGIASKNPYVLITAKLMQAIMTDPAVPDEVKAAGVTAGNAWALGIQYGIVSEDTALKAKALEVTQALKDIPWFGLEIGSPSKFTERVGAYWTQGLISGISSEQANLSLALNNIVTMFAGLPGAISPALNTTRDQINSLLSFASSSFSVISNTVSNAFSALSGLSGGASRINNTTNTYSPSFYGPQPQQTIVQNSDLYNRWLFTTR